MTPRHFGRRRFYLLALLTAGVLIFKAPLLSQTPLGGKHSASGPSISVIGVPHAGRGGEYPAEPIAGNVKGVSFGAHKVVVYAFAGGTWWVQPTAASPFTDIDGSGDWQTITHLGSTYAVLLVKSSYKPSATTTDVPKVGGDVVAVKLIQGKP